MSLKEALPVHYFFHCLFCLSQSTGPLLYVLKNSYTGSRLRLGAFPVLFFFFSFFAIMIFSDLVFIDEQPFTFLVLCLSKLSQTPKLELTLLPFISRRSVQAYLDFHGFCFCDFRFNMGHNSILFSSPLVLLLSNLDIRSFSFPMFFLCFPTLTT